MQALKQNMNDLKIRLDESRDRAERAEHEISMVKDRMESAEERAFSLNRRIRMTQLELDKIVARVEVTQKKLLTTESLNYEDRQKIQKLVDKDSQDGESLEELEDKVKETRNVASDTQSKYEGACRKCKVLEYQKSQVEKRIQHAEKSENALSSELEEMTKKITKIEGNDTGDQRDEQDEFERIHCLKDQCMTEDLRNEEAERKSQRLTKEHSTLQGKLERLKVKREEAEQGLEKMMKDMRGM